MMRVKICGMMSAGDVHLAVRAGADSLGFVTEYPVPVPWNVPRRRAAELITGTPPFVTTTAVVGGPVDHVLQIARTVRPHFLQLHGDESLDEIRRVCAGLAGTGIKVLKALRIDVDTGRAQFAVDDPVEAASALAESGIAGLVVDSKTTSRPAGTGVALDWSVARRVAASIRLPLILAGGLNPENVGRAIAQVQPYGVDVISGVESAAGVKSGRLIAAFVRAVRQVQASIPQVDD
jgi:phosphoribosylanthranilate isomerase